MPGWLGGSQPRPAGREALRSITPERTQIPSPGERSHPALRARKHFQLWSHPTLTFPHLSYPFRALGDRAMALEREPLTAAPPAEGLQRCFSRVCQGERLSIPAWEEISPPSQGAGTAPSD